MRRPGLLLLTLAALACGSALAEGRAACRVEFGISARLSCYADQSLVALGPVEAYAGLELRYPGPYLTPYTGVLYRGEGWWGAAEVARSAGPETGWLFRLLFGMTWR